METIYERAKDRVIHSESLKPYSRLLLDYDWSNREDHLSWVATAPEGVILIWCRVVEKDDRS